MIMNLKMSPTVAKNGVRSVDEYVKLIIPTLYHAYPDSIPFNGGIDRAELLGQESAKAFAKRKIAEQAVNDRRFDRNSPGRVAMRERAAKERERKLSRDAAVPTEMLPRIPVGRGTS